MVLNKGQIPSLLLRYGKQSCHFCGWWESAHTFLSSEALAAGFQFNTAQHEMAVIAYECDPDESLAAGKFKQDGRHLEFAITALAKLLRHQVSLP